LNGKPVGLKRQGAKALKEDAIPKKEAPIVKMLLASI